LDEVKNKTISSLTREHTVQDDTEVNQEKISVGRGRICYAEGRETLGEKREEPIPCNRIRDEFGKTSTHLGLITIVREGGGQSKKKEFKEGIGILKPHASPTQERNS